MAANSFIAKSIKKIRKHIPFQNSLYGMLRFFRIPMQLGQHLPIYGWMTVKTKSGKFKMFSDGDILENSIFWSRDGRGDDATSFQIWENIAEVSDAAILDIGANTGLYALIAKTVRPDLPVIAFEPVRRIAARLQKNIADNKYVIYIVEKAVSDRNGSALFHDSAEPSATTNAYSASLEDSFSFNKHSYTVDVISIDGFIPSNKPVSLIKLDVEMHELSAVRGMLGTIARDQPAILIEVLDSEIGQSVTKLLEGFGYEFYRIEEHIGIFKVDQLTPSANKNFNNLACMPDVFVKAGLDKLLCRN